MAEPCDLWLAMAYGGLRGVASVLRSWRAQTWFPVLSSSSPGLSPCRVLEP